MEDLILFIFAVVLCFTGRFVLYLFSKRKKKKKKKRDSTPLEVKYLNKRFKIKSSIIDKKSFMLIVSIIDSLIVSITVLSVIRITDILFLELLIGLVMVLILIFILYDIIGKILIMKGYDKK